MLFLNLYISKSSQDMISKNKEATMIERCHLIAAEIQALDVITPDIVTTAVQKMGTLRVSRVIVTDSNGLAIFDSLHSDSAVDCNILLPEVVRALGGYDVFISDYQDGKMFSRAAAPIMSSGALLGCVYLTEYDATQGALIASIQRNMLTITIALEFAVVLFSLLLSRAFTKRVNHLIFSMHTIREGEYSHRVDVKGNNEIAILGQEFNELLTRLQAMEETRKQFVSNASHELKTPLASIKLLSDSILQNEMDMATVREFVEDIGNEADRLNRMSQNLLSLSKADANLISGIEITEISSVAQRAVRMLSPLANIHDVKIQMQLTEICPILTSEDDLYQIIFNLIENGIKYNKPGGNLYITLQRAADTATLTIKDEGNGIPEESLPYIFDRFYRVDKARSRSTGGSGLGLSIVKELVYKHKGEIAVESAVGAGTAFTLHFPVICEEGGE